MARVKLTKNKVDEFKCPEGKAQVFLRDTGAPGLAVRATKGAKAYVFQSKISGNDLRITIGDVKVWNLDAAQAEARRLQTIVDAGRDPRQVKSEITAADEAARAAVVAAKEAAELDAQRRQLTLGEAWEAYCEARRPREGDRPEVRSLKWGERSSRDHLKMMQPKRTKRGKELEAGVLASWASLPLSEVTATKVADWLDAETSKRPTQAALGYRMLRAFLNWCAGRPEYAYIVDKDACSKNVSKDHLPKSKAKDDCLQREQLQLWFEGVRQIKNRRVSAYLQGMLITGARPNELAGLKWADVDFQWRSLTMRDKVEGERTIPLTPYLEALLRELNVWNQTPPPAFRILHGRKVANDLEQWKSSEFVFSSSRSTSGQIENAGTLHREMLRNAGIPNVTLHGLRRSFGSLSEWCEVPVGIVAQIQGHKPSATAEKHYRVRPLDLLRMWHGRIEDWFLIEAGIKPRPAPEIEQPALAVA